VCTAKPSVSRLERRQRSERRTTRLRRAVCRTRGKTRCAEDSPAGNDYKSWARVPQHRLRHRSVPVFDASSHRSHGPTVTHEITRAALHERSGFAPVDPCAQAPSRSRRTHSHGLRCDEALERRRACAVHVLVDKRFA
jgi:hypothetical protein